MNRKTFLRKTGMLAGVGMLGPRMSRAGANPGERPALNTTHLFDIHIIVNKREKIGQTPVGLRRNYYIGGGDFTGEHLRGEVLPVGADWAIRRQDGVSVLDIRTTLRTDDQALIYTNYQGFISDPEPIRAIFSAPENGGYWRTTWTFETAAEKYLWMNRIIGIGIGSSDETVDYTVYAVL